MLRVNDTWVRPVVFNSYFWLGKLNNTAKLYLRRSFSNIFLTLTDLTDSVIVCRTSGSSGIEGQKRKKKSALALEQIVKSLHIYFKLYNIENVKIITRMKLNRYYYCLKQELNFSALSL